MHSLKGNAGNLGALALMQAAAALETAIQDQTRDLETANKEQTMDREIASQGLAPDLDAGLTDLERQLQDLATASAPWLAGRDARGQVGWKAAMIPAGMPLKVPSGGQPDVQTQAQAQAARSAEAAGEGAAPVPTPSLATARLAALRDALQRHDLAAQDHYEELAPTLAAAWGEPETQALGEAIADLRFGAALAQLDRRVPSAAMDGAGNG
jgi:HPt (histidine-containing phosphotransfer) domain-containing protein